MLRKTRCAPSLDETWLSSLHKPLWTPESVSVLCHCRTNICICVHLEQPFSQGHISTALSASRRMSKTSGITSSKHVKRILHDKNRHLPWSNAFADTPLRP